jgi:hypothetical protein
VNRRNRNSLRQSARDSSAGEERGISQTLELKLRTAQPGGTLPELCGSPPEDSPLWKQEISHFHLCFVQLRLRIADGAVKQGGNFMVLISLNLVQGENSAAALGKRFDGASKRDTIDRSCEVGIGRSDIVR